MPPKKDYYTTISSEEQFMSYFNSDNKKLVVCDVFPSWSGPCECLFPTYKNFALNIDDFEKRVDIILLDQDYLEEYKNDRLRDPSCRPKILFFLEGAIIDEVLGANIPSLIDKVNRYIPLAY